MSPLFWSFVVANLIGSGVCHFLFGPRKGGWWDRRGR